MCSLQLPSKRSIFVFTSMNSLLLFVSFLQNISIEYFLTHFHIYCYLYIYFIFLLRNYFLLYFINKVTQHKPTISDIVTNLVTEKYPYEFHWNIIVSTFIETSTHITIIKYYIFTEPNTYIDLVTFIPISFLFEIIFDFFHYITHRLLHQPSLYKYFHKKHHTFIHTTSIITFYQDPIEIIITNSLPVLFTLQIIPRLSYFQLNAIIIYKTYSEICGHLGKKCYPTSSFCQFIWLPKLLQIELYGEDHSLHHSKNYCNYSKRFSLWDKVFGTYKPAIKIN